MGPARHGAKRVLLLVSLVLLLSGSSQGLSLQDLYLSDQLGAPEGLRQDSTLLQQLQQQQRQLEQEEGNEVYILEDKDYPKSPYEHYNGVGQVSGLTALPDDNVAIFHRAGREWTQATFEPNTYTLVNASSAPDNLIKNNTIMILDGETGRRLGELGAGLFYLPHSIASDQQGHLWVTDVGRHQVMRLPAAHALKSRSSNLSSTHVVWPDIVLGEAFVPGSDSRHFCQPSEVVVSPDGRLVFVADGYCNQRVMVFTGNGNFLTSFGEQHNMQVVHSLALFEERNLICAADRENGRILCFKAGLDGDLSSIGELMLVLNYPLGRVFALATIGPNHLLVSSNQPGTGRYDLAALNPFSKELKSTWSSSDLLTPHSLASTRDRGQVYAADISADAYRKVFKFYVIQRQ